MGRSGVHIVTPERLAEVNPDNLRFLEMYKVDMMVRDLSVSTQSHYQYDLKQWFVWLLLNRQNISSIEATDDDITAYLYFCKQNGNGSARITYTITMLSAFYKFLRKKRLMREDPVEFIEAPRKHTPVVEQTFLTVEQVCLMREKLIELGNLQWRLYATISLSTMARLNAIASIRWTRIDLQHNVIKNIVEKEGKVVDLYFNEEVKLLILKLKQEREAKGQDDYGWLWYTGRCSPTKHINNGTLWDWSHRIGRLIGVPTLHPHDFRHSGATLLKNSGMSLEDISTLLNHESTDTTKKFYIKTDLKRINELKRISEF